MEKRKLFVDVDGCALNFVWAFIPILKNYGIELKPENYERWELLNNKYPRKIVYKYVVETWESDLFEQLPMIEGFKEFAYWAKDHYKIIYNTVVPKPYVEKRIKNLNQHGLLKDINADIYFAKTHKDKVRIIEKEGNGIAFIDDNPKNVSTVKKYVKDILSIWFNLNGRMKVYDMPFQPDHTIFKWQNVKKLLQNQSL